MHDNIAAKGFDYFWADETEPDLPPDGAYLSIGPGTQYFNVYPLFHTAAIYDGVRRDVRPGAKNRVAHLVAGCISGRSKKRHHLLVVGYFAYVGHVTAADPNRTEHCRLRHCIYGQRYWRLAGLPYKHTPDAPPLIDPSDARDNVRHYDDYPELYVRWFEYGTFLPTMRTHGTRKYNEVWSYGPRPNPSSKNT